MFASAQTTCSAGHYTGRSVAGALSVREGAVGDYTSMVHSDRLPLFRQAIMARGVGMVVR